MGGYESMSINKSLLTHARAAASLLRLSLPASAAPTPTVLPRQAIGARFALVHR